MSLTDVGRVLSWIDTPVVQVLEQGVEDGGEDTAETWTEP
jgi:hypothetical protein